jgi:hypothetical protein
VNTKCASCCKVKGVEVKITTAATPGGRAIQAGDAVHAGYLCHECYDDLYNGDPSNKAHVRRYMRKMRGLTLDQKVA